jgi:hypothetical protein
MDAGALERGLAALRAIDAMLAGRTARGVSERFRELADHLEEREAAPSLAGYGLCDGLRAAADILDGHAGPMVQADNGYEIVLSELQR